ncbi:hypothetical protein BC351_38415 [Paenibacillus ferrarius]|uniref:Uncharacterized protein n=1 Tax=Paenibacillus ferrarius TaxID=1469647 RepID=A0A1V4H9R6_9BACL|nr:hypothetical protein [Paenibacillus ferrarius]OPH48273.1 hypothetical protein BC351_38415 [Paenibacillus ferrarius]
MILKNITYTLYLLFQFSLKVLLNKWVYGFNKILGNSGASGTQLVSKLLKKAVYFIFVVYLFWTALTVLFQVFFHHAPIAESKLNVILLGVLILCALFILNFPENREMTRFIIYSNYAVKIKRYLIVYNSLLGVIICWILIFFLSVPFLVVQFYYHGINGFIFIAQYLFILFIFGVIVDFVKYFMLLIKQFYMNHIHLFYRSMANILVCILVPFLVMPIHFFIDKYYLNSNTSDKSKLIIDLTSQIPVNFSTFNLDGQYYLIGVAFIIFLFFLFFILSSLFFNEASFSTKQYSFIKILNSSRFSFFVHYVRKYGFVNSDIIVALFITFLIEKYISILFPIGNFIIIVAILSLISTFFIFENRPEPILLLKRMRLPYYYSAFLFSMYLIFQLVEFGFFYIILTDRDLIDIEIMAYSTTVLFGIFLMYFAIVCYCYVIYMLEGMLESNVLTAISIKVSSIYVGMTAAFIFTVNYLTGIQYWWLYATIPFIILLLFIQFFQIYQKHNRRNQSNAP